MVAENLQPELPTASHTSTAESPAAGSDGATRGGGTPGFRYTIEAVPIDPQGPATIVILRMAGEIDLYTQPAVETALRSGLHAGAHHLLVDFSAVTFCGARGLGAVADTAPTAAEHGIGYAVSGLTPHLDRAAATLWQTDAPTRYRGLALAMTTIQAAHVRRE